MPWDLVGSIATGIAGAIIYLFYLRKGQFEDPEEVKYQMFQEKDSTEDA